MPKAREKKAKKQMEYADAPSGYVKLYNYKEPFMEYSGGFGYQGVLLFDGETDKVQCHECGNWVLNLPSHLWHEHRMKANLYKQRVGLSPTTSLVNEKIREKLIERGMAAQKNLIRGMGTFSKEKRQAIRAATIKAMNSLEYKNSVGTCPLQLLTRLKQQAQDLGRTPRAEEVGSYATYVKIFGSFKNACDRAGLKPRGRGVNINRNPIRYTHEIVKDLVERFIKEHGRRPTGSDCRRGLLPNENTIRRHYMKLSEIVV